MIEFVLTLTVVFLVGIFVPPLIGFIIKRYFRR